MVKLPGLLIFILCTASVSYSQESELLNFRSSKSSGCQKIKLPQNITVTVDYPDTVTCRTSQDSVRYCYSYYNMPKKMCELYQRLENGNWKNTGLLTTSYTDNEKVSLNQNWLHEEWSNVSRFKELTDSQGRLLEQSSEYYDNSWHYESRRVFSYMDNALQSMLLEYWSYDQPALRVLEIYEYENSFLKALLIQQEFPTGWVNLNRGEWKRNDAGKPEEYHYYKWDNDHWKDSTRVFWFYDNTSRETLYVSEAYTGIRWEYFIKVNSIYSADTIVHAFSKWNNGWTKWLKFDSVFNDQNLLESETILRGYNNEWQNSRRTAYTYNNAGDTETELIENWQDNLWIPESKSEMKYDDQLRLSEYSHMRWIGAWVPMDGSFYIEDPWKSNIYYIGSKVKIIYKKLSSVSEDDPVSFYISQNYPNPFNPATKILVRLPESANLNITIYNIQGSEIKTLHNSYTPAGDHEFLWNGTDNNNQPVCSGVYFYKVYDGKSISTNKMLLLK